jgi:small conductance mechanosensitive channel
MTAADLAQFSPTALWAQYGEMITELGLRVVGALIVLVVGLRVAKWLSNLVKRAVDSQPLIDPTLGRFFASLVQYLGVVVVVITVLQVFGVQATSLVAVLGAASLAVGLALQGTLGSLAAGVMLILFRPYKVGDFVTVAGQSGTVREIGLFTTMLATLDNVQITIPNGQIWGATITNFSGFETRRVDLDFQIAAHADLDAAIAIVREVVAADARPLAEPASPWADLTKVGEYALTVTSRTWVQARDYWDFHGHLLRTVRVRFADAGIPGPVPLTRDLGRAGL